MRNGMRNLSVFLLAATAFAQSGTMLYVGSWPGKILAIDEATYRIVKEIPLKTGVPRNAILSNDRKKIIVTTMKDTGIEIVDLATGTVGEPWTLNQGNDKVNISGIAIDPTDKLLYAVTTVRRKLIDRFEIGKPQFSVIDLDQKKIVRTAEFPKDEQAIGFRGQYRVSPDGKYLYQFSENILVFDTANFKLVEKIELSKPQYPGMETIFLQPGDDPHDDPGHLTTVFNTTDPVVHKAIFGIANFDLNERKFDFTPVGPAATGMMGLRLTPDRKTGYTVAIQGVHGDRRCEFLVFDMNTKKILRQAEFAGRTRFTFSVSSDGKKLYIYGAGNTLEVFDAATLKPVTTLDVQADMTTPLLVVMPKKG